MASGAGPERAWPGNALEELKGPTADAAAMLLAMNGLKAPSESLVWLAGGADSAADPVPDTARDDASGRAFSARSAGDGRTQCPDGQERIPAHAPPQTRVSARKRSAVHRYADEPAPTRARRRRTPSGGSSAPYAECAADEGSRVAMQRGGAEEARKPPPVEGEGAHASDGADDGADGATCDASDATDDDDDDAHGDLGSLTLCRSERSRTGYVGVEQKGAKFRAVAYTDWRAPKRLGYFRNARDAAICIAKFQRCPAEAEAWRKRREGVFQRREMARRARAEAASTVPRHGTTADGVRISLHLAPGSRTGYRGVERIVRRRSRGGEGRGPAAAFRVHYERRGKRVKLPGTFATAVDAAVAYAQEMRRLQIEV